MKRYSHLTVVIFFLFLISCEEGSKNQSVVTGTLKVHTDASFLPVLQAQSNVFSHHYPNASLQIITSPENECFEKLMKEETEAILVSRALTKEEKEYLTLKKFAPQTYNIASDALVFIVAKSRKDSVIRMEDLQKIASGEINDWKDIGGQPGEIQWVVDDKNSSNLRYLADSLRFSKDVKLLAMGSEEKVVDYVTSHPGAIGVIGLSWISDDPATNEWLKKINVMSVRVKEQAISPFQENLYDSVYPFKRNILLITLYQKGLGIGFASWLLGQEGQRLFLKFGLLPAKMPGREVIIRN